MLPVERLLQNLDKVSRVSLPVILHGQTDPQVESSLLLSQDAQHLLSLRQLREGDLYHFITLTERNLHGVWHLALQTLQQKRILFI